MMKTQNYFSSQFSTPTHFKVKSSTKFTNISKTKNLNLLSKSNKERMLRSTRFFLKSQNKIVHSNTRENQFSQSSKKLFLPPVQRSNSPTFHNKSNKKSNLNTSTTSKMTESDIIANEYFFLYQPAKHSEGSFDVISAYGINTYKGLVRNYNEDRVTVIINAKSPFQGVNWPNVSFFGIYDGHAGNKCADYLKTHLHNIIFRSSFFPNNPLKAIEDGFKELEKNYNNSIYKNKIYTDFSGSCSLITIIINKTCYVVNLGDSRAIYCKGGGDQLFQVTRDHKPNDPIEHNRIKKGGGNIYQTPGTGFGFQLPFRILPGKLSVNIFYN